MSITALQLASFVADLEDFFEQEKSVLRDIEERTSGGGNFEEGLLLGAQSLRSVFEVEHAVDISLRKLEKALRPLQLASPITDIRRREILTLSGDSFMDNVEEAIAVIGWRLILMKSLREKLLALNEEEMCQAYSENVDKDSLARWERGLSDILRKGDS